MEPAVEGQQAELIELASHAPVRRSAASIGTLQMRHDHAVLVGIAGLLSCSVVFAVGVERGKQLARAEQPVLPPAVAAPALAKAEPARTLPAVAPSTTASGAKATAQTPATSARSVQVKTAGRSSKFAIQVVAFRQSQLAQRELQRLHRQGETAFLVTRQERLVLYVGPFSSKARAAVKLASLRRRYQDCFIRALQKPIQET